MEAVVRGVGGGCICSSYQMQEASKTPYEEVRRGRDMAMGGKAKSAGGNLSKGGGVVRGEKGRALR